MYLTFNILMDCFKQWNTESHVAKPCDRTFAYCSMLPKSSELMRSDVMYICRLSKALPRARMTPGMFYLCLRDRIKDAGETDELLDGMTIINENIEIETVFSAVQELFFRISQWYQQMQDALISDRSLQYIIDLSENVIGNTINVSDSAFALLARTHDIPTIDPISQALEEYGHHPEETLRLFRRFNRFESWKSGPSLSINTNPEFCKFPLVSKVFRFHNTYFTHAVMVCDHHELTPGILDLFSMLSDVLTIWTQQEWANKSGLSHRYDTFITDMLSGRFRSSEEISERARYAGVIEAGSIVLSKITVSEGQEPTLGRLGQELSALLPRSEVVMYEQSVVCVMHFFDGEAIDEELNSQITDVLNKYGAVCGLSDYFDGLPFLREAYEQATMALKYGHELRGESLFGDEAVTNGPVFPYQQRILLYILGESPSGEQLWRSSIYWKALKTLHDYDGKHATGHFMLLNTYLRNERKATETSAVLHMHRNNVIYHVGRIEKLIGMNLDDYRTRLGLEISYLMAEMYGLPESEE